MFSSRKLSKGYSEVVGIIEGIQQVFVERMYVLKTGKSLCFESVSTLQSRFKDTRRTEDQSQLFSESLLRILDLACIEVPYPGDFKTTADLSR